jgi:hypothetical protein
MFGATLPLTHARARDRNQNRGLEQEHDHDHEYEMAHFAPVATIACGRSRRGCSLETQFSTLPWTGRSS